LAVEPQLVLLDEPFSALDPTLRATIRAEVLAILRDAGATAILVTHDQDEALSSADDVAVIHGGVVVQHGPPHELYAAPETCGLARFLGVGNFFTTTVTGGIADTPLGPVEVAGHASGEATVLVRPEQVRANEHGSTGVTGRVVRSEFHGHSTVLAIALDTAEGPEITSVDRSPTPPQVGSQVHVTLSGPAMAWPGTDDEPPW
jgi:iron(III) transport system ATP-binding protein